MRPLSFLGLMIALTVLARVLGRIVTARRESSLRRLAGEWGMRYAPRDLFNLAGRLGRCFPIPGASDLRVLDLIYGVEADRHQYVFTAEYTLGVAATHRRECRAMTVCEPREAAGPCAPPTLAPAHLPLIEQYRHLRQRERAAAKGQGAEPRPDP